MIKRIVGAALLVPFSAVAIAQTSTTTTTTAPSSTTTTEEYYVVQDPSTKKCTIVNQKPTSTTTTMVGDGVFKSRTEAETGMKKVTVCTQ